MHSVTSYNKDIMNKFILKNRQNIGETGETIQLKNTVNIQNTYYDDDGYSD